MADQILLVGHLFDAAPLAWGLLPLMFRVTPTKVGYLVLLFSGHPHLRGVFNTSIVPETKK